MAAQSVKIWRFDSVASFPRTAAFVPVLAAALLSACTIAPPKHENRISHAMPAGRSGLLRDHAARIAVGLAEDQSAFWLLDRGDEAFNARLALVDEADYSLDIQYFIWRPEPTGRLLMHRLIQAADRGVRVRLLLDDMTLAGKDAEYVALDSHPSIEVRSYNPWSRRGFVGRIPEYFGRRSELNNRMHLKTMVADNHFAMVGGRNIGDRYFGVYEKFVHNDLDIMAAGPIVTDVSDSFDEYWNSSESYPITDLASDRNRGMPVEEFASFIESEYRAHEDRLTEFPLQPADWTAYLESLSHDFHAGVGRLEYDRPFVGDRLPDRIYPSLMQSIASATEEVLLVTAYFVPDDDFLELLETLTARGVRVVVLTNSLSSNNHPIAHTGYRQSRRRTLAAGVELYEARADAKSIIEQISSDVEPGWLGLHAKAVLVDRRHSFVGSPNIDPRSLIINSEIGYFVDSESLADRMLEMFERDIAPQNAWRVTMDDEGWLTWTGNPRVLSRQPAKGLKERLIEFFVNWLPLKQEI